MMHTHNDTRTRDNTLRLYTGHSRRYLRVRATARTLIVALPLIGGFILALTKAY